MTIVLGFVGVDGNHLIMLCSRVVPVSITKKMFDYVVSDITTDALLGLDSYRVCFPKESSSHCPAHGVPQLF